MPSELSEPTLDELSAYVDDELEPAHKARVAQHVAGCVDCRARVDGLRQTVNLVRALPMESPPRTFTIPAQRQRAFRRWAPVGWIGSAAAAVLVIAFGVGQLSHGLGGGAGTTALRTSSDSRAAQDKQAYQAAGAPAVSPLSREPATLASQGFRNASPVEASLNGSQRLAVATDAATYSGTGAMRVRVVLYGSPSSSTNSRDQGLTLTLVRGGAGVALDPVGIIGSDGAPIFGGTYTVGGMPLGEPRAGDYRLVATWVVPDGSGRLLQASVSVRLSN
jgi:putative zinc finger protein